MNVANKHGAKNMVREIFDSFATTNSAGAQIIGFHEAVTLWRFSARSRKGLHTSVAEVPEMDEALWEGELILHEATA